MSKHHSDELPSIDPTALAGVTGGAGGDPSTMLPLLMMMRSRSAAAAPAQPAQPAQPAGPPRPKILLNGVEQPASALVPGADGALTFEV